MLVILGLGESFALPIEVVLDRLVESFEPSLSTAHRGARKLGILGMPEGVPCPIVSFCKNKKD